MIDFGKWAFANKKLVYFLLAVLLAGGALAAYDMPKLEDPEIKVKMAMVVATYPGASAHEVEMEVTDPLEKSIRAIGEVDNVSSWSYNDLALIEVELKSTRGTCCAARSATRGRDCRRALRCRCRTTSDWSTACSTP